MTKRWNLWSVLALAVLGLGACDDEEDPMMPPMVEETTFQVTVENVSAAYDFAASGVFNTPAGAAAPGPLTPGGIYEFSFSAPPGASLSFVTMMVQSNDFFYAPDGDGIALWNEDGSQVTGDVTGQVLLWDSGTEINEEPGLGENQVIRQSGPDSGPVDPDTDVRLAPDVYDNLPAVEEVLRVTLSSDGPTRWTARIENVGTAETLTTSDGAMHPVPLSPGVFVVHSGADPIFTAGEPDRGQGLEGIAEDGTPGDLASELGGRTGVTGILSPGAWAVHQEASVLFAAGQPDYGVGLEAIAEDGDPSGLVASLGSDAGVSSAGAFNTPEGASGPGPLTPGGSYSFELMAVPGDRLSLATMYVQSNDLFFAPGEPGIDLFPGGTAVNGDVTGMILLWDAGTEVNERPGVGLFQAPRQPGPDTGTTENGDVRQVDDGYSYGAVDARIRVTITPVG